VSAQRECDEALNNSSITINTLHEYTYLRNFLEKSGLSIDDDEDNLTKLSNVIYNLKHSEYDAKKLQKICLILIACKLKNKNCKARSMQ
jgi:hypothetical protein